MINGFINGQDLRLSQPKIAADTIDYLEAVFKFQTADWNGLEKWAHFQKGDVVYDVMLEGDKISKEKHLNLSAGYWSVYLHGNAFENGKMVQRITTDKARLSVEESGVLDGEPLPLVPPSVGEQLDARITALEKGGGGGTGGGTTGEDVEDGGYYIPSVSAEGVLSWSASKEDMPPVPSSVVKGDNGDNGSNGVSPTVSVTEIAGGHRLTITDVNGTKTADVMDGADGKQGAQGTSVTVKSVSESTADGGSNVVTFSDGKTLTIKNGGKGSTGGKGDDGDDGFGVFPCGTNAPTSVGQTATALMQAFHLPAGYTLRVGDMAIGSNGYIAKVTAISGSNVTLYGTGISIKGPQGETGAAGVGITSVTQTTTSSTDGGTNVVTVTLTNGTKSTFNVKNGSKGSAGAAGPVGPAGSPGANGTDGYTPVRGVDYFTDADKSEFSEYIASELAKRGQLAPEYANSIDECTDTSKMYVLPDGFIYAYMLTEVEDNSPAYTNVLPLATDTDRTTIYQGKGYITGQRLSSSGALSAQAGSSTSGFIPVKEGDVLRIKGITPKSGTTAYVHSYNSSNTKVKSLVYSFGLSSPSGFSYELGDDDSVYSDDTIVVPITSATFGAVFDAVRFNAGVIDENTIVTINQEIKEGGGTIIANAWVNTGHAFVPADYEDRIIAVEEAVAEHTADIEMLKKGITNTDTDPLEVIKKWDAPIYDANIPVFQLATEKAAIADDEKTVAAVYAKYDALMARHPNYITKTDLGVCSDGVTHVYRYDFREPEPHRGVTGAKEWSETKAKAIIVSGIHWEWGGIFALYNALEEIADDPELYHLRRNTHLIVLPVCNPYAVANMSVRNANLVEIHRNFEVDFIYPGESGYIELGERSHGGTDPLSEVETQYIDNIMKNNTDAAFFLTCHSNQTDTVYGTGFTWASPATYYMCNMHYRLVDKLSKVWMERYGDELAAGMAEYRTENTPEWDNRLGSAYLSTTNGTETKQATKYGIQATNIEVTDSFVVHGTTANPEPALSSFTMSRGAEVYVNFFLTAFGCYDHKDKSLYAVGD